VQWRIRFGGRALHRQQVGENDLRQSLSKGDNHAGFWRIVTEKLTAHATRRQDLPLVLAAPSHSNDCFDPPITGGDSHPESDHLRANRDSSDIRIEMHRCINLA